MNVSTLFSLIKSDLLRLAEFWQRDLTVLSGIRMLLMPSTFAIMLYRVSNFFYINGLGYLAWPVWGLNITITGADLHPHAQIGRGFILGHTVGVILSGKIGDNVTIFGRTSIGGGMGDLSKDVGAGPGMPLIHDDVIIGIDTTILGPLEIGALSRVAPCTFVTETVPSDCVAYGNPASIRERTGNTE